MIKEFEREREREKRWIKGGEKRYCFCVNPSYETFNKKWLLSGKGGKKTLISDSHVNIGLPEFSVTIQGLCNL